MGVTPAAAAAGDFDDDGFLDLAVSDTGAGTITVLRNRTDGSFEETARLEGFGASIEAADLDGDGDVDLATGSLLIFLNEAGGVFGEPVSFTLGGNSFSSVARDLDGDGDLDLATATGTVLSLRFNHSMRAFSSDLNDDSVPDECSGGFRRGDASGDGTVDTTDVHGILNYLFKRGAAPRCMEAAAPSASNLGCGSYTGC